ncbi:MAG: HEAT repeat domain-containing protein, partial [Kofleriaceae bacterium]
AAPPPIDETVVRTNAQTVLRAALHEAEPLVRVQGSDAVGAVKDPLAIPDLTRMTEADADADVRGHSAGALGAIGATTTAALLAKLEASAAAPLKVWYASALARLGDQAAIRRLLTYARNPELAVAFQATIALAEVSQPGDQKTLGALRALAAHEAELNAIQPYAGALILSKMAALRDPDARKLLYAILTQPDEGARLAAAEGLAKLGDDAGRALLHALATNPAAPNQLVAAVVQVALGEYGGVDVITKALGSKDADTRRLAARALGDVGEKTGLPPLIALAGDKDWTVRIAVARAIVAIVGIDQQVLAQASVDWTRSALTSQDWATRKAAAGVLGDIPKEQAVPLLAQAIADHNPAVRLAASKSAGKIKSAEAAAKVVAAVDGESDPKVKEQQIRSLGEIGTVAGPAAHDTLARLSEAHSRLGVLAAGSLLSVGDEAGKAKLESAVAAGSPTELRLAAVEAASATGNPLVVPTLKLGVLDKIFNIKFLAAEGLATMNVEKAAALPVLTEALASKDADVVGRAMAALTRFGEQIKAAARTPSEMLDSPDPRQRLAAIPIVRAMPASEGVPLLRRLVVDPDAEVRHAGVDAIESVVAKDKEAAKRLYKPLVKDADPVVASKASGQLSRLVDPPVITAGATPPAGDALPKVQLALDDARATSVESTAARATFDALAADFATTVASTKREDATIAHVGTLPASLDKAAIELDGLASKLEAAAKAVADTAGASPAPAAARLVADAQALATTAREAATSARSKTTQIAQEARHFLEIESDGVQRMIATADAAIAAGNFGLAQQKLDAAAKKTPPGKHNANLDYSYATLYQRKANATQDPAAHAKLLQQATAAYTRVVQAGGPLVPKATGRIAEIGDETKATP